MPATTGFSEEDRKKLDTVLSIANSNAVGQSTIINVLKKVVEVVDQQAKHICFLNSMLNKANYHGDAQQQYNRKESFKALNLDPKIHGSDPVKIVMDIAREIESKAVDKDGNSIKINLKEDDIQRCHFLGEKKKKLICKFIPYRMKMKIILNKRHINGAKTGKYKDVFITEDLTPMRSRLVWTMKNKCTTKFTKIHTREGKIRFKKEGEDADTDPWKSITNPDELFAHLDDDDEFDMEFFNKDLHGLKILPDIPNPNIVEELLDLLKDALPQNG